LVTAGGAFSVSPFPAFLGGVSPLFAVEDIKVLLSSTRETGK
jgi:hypothetical protein